MTHNPLPHPSCWVMLVNDSPERRARSEQLLRSAGYGVEFIDHVHSMVVKATYRHYDAIVIDLDGGDDAVTGVVETRRIESSRGQPQTPILGIGDVDDVARDLAIQAGFTDVIAPADLEQELVPRLARSTSPALPAA